MSLHMHTCSPTYKDCFNFILLRAVYAQAWNCQLHYGYSRFVIGYNNQLNLVDSNFVYFPSIPNKCPTEGKIITMNDVRGE